MIAERMVAHIGVDIIHIIEDEPARLIEVDGLEPKRTAEIAAAWAEQKAIKPAAGRPAPALQPQAEFRLPRRDPLTHSRPQRLQLRLTVRRTDVLDTPRTATR